MAKRKVEGVYEYVMKGAKLIKVKKGSKKTLLPAKYNTNVLIESWKGNEQVYVPLFEVFRAPSRLLPYIVRNLVTGKEVTLRGVPYLMTMGDVKKAMAFDAQETSMKHGLFVRVLNSDTYVKATRR